MAKDRVYQATVTPQPPPQPKRQEPTPAEERAVLKAINQLERQLTPALVQRILRRYLMYTRQRHRTEREIADRRRELEALEAKHRRIR